MSQHGAAVAAAAPEGPGVAVQLTFVRAIAHRKLLEFDACAADVRIFKDRVVTDSLCCLENTAHLLGTDHPGIQP